MKLIKKVMPLLSILVLMGRTLFSMIESSSPFEVISFSAFSAWVIWICFAFSYDKDIPAYAGNFKFEEGSNQAPRAFFAAIMFSLQLWVALAL